MTVSRRDLVKGALVGAGIVLIEGTNFFIPGKIEHPKMEIVAEREIADIAVPTIVSSVKGAVATTNDKDAYVSDGVELFAAFEARDRFGYKLYFSNASSALINGKRVQEPFTDGWEIPIEKWDDRRYGPVEILWRELKSESGFYNNLVPGQTDVHYREETVGSGWSLVPKGPGTHRYILQANYDGRTFRDRREIKSKKNGVVSGAHRVTLREGDDLPGKMTAWEGLPYIFGANPEQVEKLVGADCSTLVVGALHSMGRKDFPYTWSQGFEKFGDVLFRGYVDMSGQFLDSNKKAVKRSLGIKRGDVLVYTYPSKPHVAVFYQDLNNNGDPIEVVHTYDAKGVHVDTLYSGGKEQRQYSFFERFFYGEPPKQTPKKPVSSKVDGIKVLRLR